MTGGIVSRILLAGLLAGGIAGVFLTGMQRFAVVPMILEAETYETAGDGHAAGHGDAAGEEEAWAPEEGMERTAYTALTNVLAAVGFGLLLSAGYALRGGVDWRRGVVWGLAGFAAFNLAPGIGLPPELPGAAAAELGARQVWWLLTAMLTAGGLGVIAFAPRLPIKALGVVLIIGPHIVGAPHPEGQHGGLSPAELEQAFIYASLITNGVFWIVLGALTAFLFDRFGNTATA